MDENLKSILSKVGDIFSQPQTFELTAEIFKLVSEDKALNLILKDISCRIELRPIPMNWGWACRAAVKGSISARDYPDLPLRESDCFHAETEFLAFEAGISGIEWTDGELISLNFTSFGPIHLRSESATWTPQLTPPMPNPSAGCGSSTFS